MNSIKANIAKVILISLFITSYASSVTAEQSALDSMISPITNPVNFEDPRIETNIRPIFMYHKLPSDFVTGSGDIQLWAVQARFALTEKLALIATKDGYIQINSDQNLDDSEGSANLAGGLKYAFYQDDDAGQIFSGSLRYEAQTGDPDVFQGTGDGSLIFGLSGASKVADLNLVGYTGLRLGINDEDSDFWDVSLHADLPVGDFYPSLEFNMVHVVDAGSRIGLPGEGFDLVNFGSANSEGSTVVTMGVGARYRITDAIDVGASYEFPLTDREDVFAWRVTADLIARCDWVIF